MCQTAALYYIKFHIAAISKTMKLQYYSQVMFIKHVKVPPLFPDF